MATIFTRIIDGELPGRFVWRDDRVVAFLPIAALAPGHTLVVPIEPVDHWIDLDPRPNAHLWAVAQTIGAAQQRRSTPSRGRRAGRGRGGPPRPRAPGAVHRPRPDELRQRRPRAPDPAASTDQARLDTALAAPRQGHGGVTSPSARAPQAVARAGASSGSTSSSELPAVVADVVDLRRHRAQRDQLAAGRHEEPAQQRRVSSLSRSSQSSQADGGRITGIRSWIAAIGVVGRGGDDRAGAQRLLRRSSGPRHTSHSPAKA